MGRKGGDETDVSLFLQVTFERGPDHVVVVALVN